MPAEYDVYSDEIDLAAFFSTLWSGKWLLSGCALAAAGITALWLTFAPPSYETRANVTAPTKGDYASLYPGRLYEYAPEPNEVLRRIMVYMSSPDQQRKFFSERMEVSSGVYSDKVERAVKALKVNQSILGRSDLQVTSINLTFSARSPEKARNTLSAYIENVNNQVVESFARDSQAIIDQHVGAISQDIISQSGSQQRTIKLEIQLLEQALSQAQSRNIHENKHSGTASTVFNSTMIARPLEKQEFHGSSNQARSMLHEPLYEYGTEALSAMINARQAQLNVDSSKIVKMKFHRDSWKALNIDTSKARMLTIASNPWEAKRKPPIIIALILALIIGFITGSIVLLARKSWQHASRKE